METPTVCRMPRTSFSVSVRKTAILVPLMPNLNPSPLKESWITPVASTYNTSVILNPGMQEQLVQFHRSNQPLLLPPVRLARSHTPPSRKNPRLEARWILAYPASMFVPIRKLALVAAATRFATVFTTALCPMNALKLRLDRPSSPPVSKVAASLRLYRRKTDLRTSIVTALSTSNRKPLSSLRILKMSVSEMPVEDVLLARHWMRRIRFYGRHEGRSPRLAHPAFTPTDGPLFLTSSSTVNQSGNTFFKGCLTGLKRRWSRRSCFPTASASPPWPTISSYSSSPGSDASLDGPITCPNSLTCDSLHVTNSESISPPSPPLVAVVSTGAVVSDSFRLWSPVLQTLICSNDIRTEVEALVGCHLLTLAKGPLTLAAHARHAEYIKGEASKRSICLLTSLNIRLKKALKFGLLLRVVRQPNDGGSKGAPIASIVVVVVVESCTRRFGARGRTGEERSASEDEVAGFVSTYRFHARFTAKRQLLISRWPPVYWAHSLSNHTPAALQPKVDGIGVVVAELVKVGRYLVLSLGGRQHFPYSSIAASSGVIFQSLGDPRQGL
ncbi:hypothetical protein KC319_g56 [Hortaea werneckii]|nr:hypothetical protein KC319_g56 [Hortaea werneckii]